MAPSGSDGALRRDPPGEFPPLLVLVGTTGAGKSATAVRVAQRLDGEIVGCDAIQVYRGLDAATAKPSGQERARIPHHLVDVADPRRDFSLADYVRMAERAVAEIDGRGRVPVIAGGTGLYLRGLLRGIIPAPPRDPRLRERLRGMASRFGPERLHRFLARRDPRTARRVPPRDRQRIVRALEVALAGEGTWSERLARHGTWDSATERYPTLKIGLDLDVGALEERLRERVRGFFAAGLVEEVRSLLARGVPPEANALKAIGYREVLAALESGRDPEAVQDEVLTRTRRYAKRQRTWFRSEPAVVWLDASAGPAALSAKIADLWRSRRPEG